MKEINYRGGIARFNIPVDWKEEYEPSGGGTFYKDGADTGTLRLNVLDFAKTDNTQHTPFESMGFEPFRDGLYIKTDKKRFTEDGVNCILLNWQVAYEVENDHYRIASFNHTIVENQFPSEQTKEELNIIGSILRDAEFGRRLGIAGDYHS